MSTTTLFTPLSLGAIALPNRIIVRLSPFGQYGGRATIRVKMDHLPSKSINTYQNS